jgi:hypothetical protein
MNEENQLECTIASFQWQHVFAKNVSIIEKLHLKTITSRLNTKVHNVHFLMISVIIITRVH